jgi:hypothetical protein
MESFYLIVVGIAVVVLILLLTFIGIMLAGQYKKATFPPNSTTCPQGWKHDPSGCRVPIVDGNNYKNTGRNGDSYYDPTDRVSNDGLTTKTGTLSPYVSNNSPLNSSSSNNKNKMPYLYEYTLSSTSGGDTDNHVFYLDPDSTDWTKNGMTAKCAQKMWANKYNILWDGVSNYNQC